MSCSVCAGYDDHNCPCCGEGIEMKTCPDCEGSGHSPYKAYDIKTGMEMTIPELEWRMLPDDEDEADDMGMSRCKAEIETCPTCMGDGKIPICH